MYHESSNKAVKLERADAYHPNLALCANMHKSFYLVSPHDDLVINVGDVHAHRDIITEEFSHDAPKNVEVKIRPR